MTITYNDIRRELPAIVHTMVCIYRGIEGLSYLPFDINRIEHHLGRSESMTGSHKQPSIQEVLNIIIKAFMPIAALSRPNPDGSKRQYNKMGPETYAKNLKTALEGRDPNGNTWLHIAARAGAMSFTTLLLNEQRRLNMPIEPRDNLGNTPLHAATEHGNVALVSELIQQGANIHAKNNAGETPLHYAAIVPNNAAVLQVLLKHRADINEQTLRGFTPLLYALYSPYTRNTHNPLFLYASGANTEIKNIDNKTPKLLIAEGNNSIHRFFREKRMAPFFTYFYATAAVVSIAASIAFALKAAGVIGLTLGLLITAGPTATLALSICFAVGCAGLARCSAYAGVQQYIKAHESLNPDVIARQDMQSLQA